MLATQNDEETDSQYSVSLTRRDLSNKSESITMRSALSLATIVAFLNESL